jgi:hypothetical protein
MARTHFLLSFTAVLLLAVSPEAVAQCTARFDTPPSYAHGWLLDLGDFNEDGSVDTLTNAWSDGVVRVNFGSREGVFRRGTAVAQDNANAAAAGDWNGDGHLDVIYAANEQVYFLAGQGDGSFRDKSELPALSRPWHIAAGDFDGDDRLDVAIVEFDATSVRVLWGDGRGAFPENVSIPVDSITVSVGDLNDDGRDDLVLGELNPGISAVVSEPNRTFRAPLSIPPLAYHYGIVVRDVDGDGHRDVAFADPFAFTVSIYKGKGDGTFEARADHPGGPFTEGIAFGEFTGDTRLDAVAGNSIASAISILPAEGGEFGDPSSYYAGNNNYDVRVADVNRDGRDDVIAADVGGYSVLLQRGDHKFDQVRTMKVAGAIRAEAADFTGDGVPDLAAVDFDSGHVIILENANGGDFGARPQKATPVAAGPLAAVIADLDGDSKNDIVVPSILSFAFSVLHGKGDGTFAASTRAVSAPAICAAVGDVDNDGDLDIVICAVNDAEISAAALTPSVRIFLNVGNRTFAPGIDLLASAPADVALADYNGDGKTDIAIADNIAPVELVSGKLSIRLGNGDGTFGAATEYDAGVSMLDLKAADVSGDGRPDLVVSQVMYDQTGGAHGVFAIYGNDGGAFELVNVLPLDGQNLWITVADLNGDGRADLSGANGGLVYAFHNRGGFRFDAGESYRASAEPATVAAADFNGDGRNDLAVLSFFEELAVLFNETACRPKMRSVRR